MSMIVSIDNIERVVWGMGQSAQEADQDAVQNGYKGETDALVSYRASPKAIEVIEEVGGYDALQLGLVTITLKGLVASSELSG